VPIAILLAVMQKFAWLFREAKVADYSTCILFNFLRSWHQDPLMRNFFHRTKRILVVDDEDLSRKSLCVFLRDEGYDVRDAASGPEALLILTEESFDLIVTDFIMPNVDGIRLVDLIHEKWPALPVLLATAYFSVRPGNTVLAGKAEVISKPFDLNELLSTVRRLAH
jgi:CheY-like chemotaxis protein